MLKTVVSKVAGNDYVDFEQEGAEVVKKPQLLQANAQMVESYGVNTTPDFKHKIEAKIPLE